MLIEVSGNRMENLIKTLAPLKQQVSKVVVLATAVEIKTSEDLEKATGVLGKIKEVGRIIAEKKESITKPLNESLKNARAFFNPIESEYLKAEKIVKDKMIEYREKELLKAAKKEEVIVSKVEKGEMSFSKAADKLEALTPQKTIMSHDGKVQFRIVKDVEIIDEKQIPREYLIPDMVKIRKVALSGVLIPGVKTVEKQIVAGTNKIMIQ